MNKKIIIESLAMDLKRVALGFYRKSLTMAEQFRQEALKREKELEAFPLDNYLAKLVDNTRKTLSRDDPEMAEDALMLSVLFQNYAQEKFK